jgi:hypothetical protein
MFSCLMGYLDLRSISFAKFLCSGPDINSDEYVRAKDLGIWERENRQIWSASIAPVPRNYWNDSGKCPLSIPEPTMAKLKQ